jgi:superfamily II DNA/RNA helicase
MALHMYQTKECPVLVCNNYASRGLDTIGTKHVI